jgi:hypothetical protein
MFPQVVKGIDQFVSRIYRKEGERPTGYRGR